MVGVLVLVLVFIVSVVAVVSAVVLASVVSVSVVSYFARVKVAVRATCLHPNATQLIEPSRATSNDFLLSRLACPHAWFVGSHRSWSFRPLSVVALGILPVVAFLHIPDGSAAGLLDPVALDLVPLGARPVVMMSATSSLVHHVLAARLMLQTGCLFALDSSKALLAEVVVVGHEAHFLAETVVLGHVRA